MAQPAAPQPTNAGMFDFTATAQAAPAAPAASGFPDFSTPATTQVSGFGGVTQPAATPQPSSGGMFDFTAMSQATPAAASALAAGGFPDFSKPANAQMAPMVPEPKKDIGLGLFSETSTAAAPPAQGTQNNPFGGDTAAADKDKGFKKDAFAGMLPAHLANKERPVASIAAPPTTAATAAAVGGMPGGMPGSMMPGMNPQMMGMNPQMMMMQNPQMAQQMMMQQQQQQQQQMMMQQQRQQGMQQGMQQGVQQGGDDFDKLLMGNLGR